MGIIEDIKRFDVVIYNYDTRLVCSVIGISLRESKANKREMTGLSKCNSDYGCMAIEIKEGKSRIKEGDSVRNF